MKSILACLLGLTIISHAADSGEQFSWDSDEEGSRTYDGVVVQVYKPTDGEPVITLGTDLDDHESTYCLTLLRVFEALGYDLTATTSTDDDYEEVSGSSVDLADANCVVSETSTTTFTIDCNDVNGAGLQFNFTFTENENGNEGLEYTIELENYDFVSDSAEAQLVLVQSVEDCSTEYAYSADSGEIDEDNDSVEVTETPNRRRMPRDDTDDDDTEDTEDTDESVEGDESDDGMSEEEGEFDAGFAQFIVSGQAMDICEDGSENIDSSLIYNEDDEELHIVFNHFDCTLFIDPSFAIDKSKIDSAAHSVSMVIGLMIGFIASLLF